MENKKRILVWGAGSIGIYLAAKLFAAGYDVYVVGRKKLESVSVANEILFENNFFQLPPQKKQLKFAEKFDYIFVTTKLYDVDDVVQQIIQKQIQYKYIVFVQNGFVCEFVDKQIPRRKMIVSCVHTGYNLCDSQIKINQSRLGWSFANNIKGKEMALLFYNAKISATLVENLNEQLAIKLIVVSASSALGAIKNISFERILNDPFFSDFALKTLRESYNILSKKYKLPTFSKVKKVFIQTIQDLSGHYSSMWQDAQIGRATEIEFLNGWIYELAKRQNQFAPYNSILLSSL